MMVHGPRERMGLWQLRVRRQLRRRKSKQPDVLLWMALRVRMQLDVVSPEDLILSRLDWARDSASASQYQDVAQFLAAVSGLDVDYLEHWAGALGVLEQLRELGRS